tara:strand:- start:211 stop:2220 length:2010 start_codon:yes stop_codon:yes gene_type:complete
MKIVFNILLTFFLLSSNAFTQIKEKVISIDDSKPFSFTAPNQIYNKSFDIYLKEALNDVIILTERTAWKQKFAVTSWNTFFVASDEQRKQESVEDIIKNSKKLGQAITADIILVRNVEIAKRDSRKIATALNVTLTLIDIQNSKELRTSNYEIIIKGRTTSQKKQSIVDGLTEQLIDIFGKIYNRENRISLESYKNRAARPVVYNREFSIKHSKNLIEPLDFTVGDKSIMLNDLTFITSGADNGNAYFIGDKLYYTPRKGFTGKEIISYRVEYYDQSTKSTISSQSKKITIDVTNIAPRAKSGFQKVRQDGTKTFNLEGTDSDGDNLEFLIVKDPRLGRIVQSKKGSKEVTYIPRTQNLVGADNFKFRVFDGVEYSEEIVYNIEIIKVNKSPTVESFEVDILHDTDYQGEFIGFDPDNDKLSYRVTSKDLITNKGEIRPQGSTFTFQPRRGVTGQFTFEYQAEDSNGGVSNIATVVINITNQKPIAKSREYPVPFSEEFIFELDAIDYDILDAPQLTVDFRLEPFGLFEKVKGKNYTYRYINTEEEAEEKIIYRVFDGAEYSEYATITLQMSKSITQSTSSVRADAKPSSRKSVSSPKPKTQPKPVTKPKPTKVPSIIENTSNDEDEGGGSNMTLILVLLLVIVLAAAGGGGGGGSDPTGGVDIGITVP